MPNNNLTLLGEEPHLKALEHLVEYSTKDELRERVKRLFITGNALEIMYPPCSGHGWDGTAEQSIEYLLRLLPANHEVIQEVLYRADLIFNESTNMSALELKAALGGVYPDGSATNHLELAFDIGREFGPDSIYNSLKAAAYHLANENIKHPKLLGYSNKKIKHPKILKHLSDIGEQGMLGYSHKKHGEVLAFINFIEESKLSRLISCNARISSYAKLGDEKAIKLFVEALERNDECVDKFVGKRVKENLIENGFPEDALKKLIYNIDDSKIRDKAREYFMI